MDEKREIPNRYEDYKPIHHECIKIPEPDLALKIESAANNLLSKLESQTISDDDGTSVYTGASGIAFLYFMLGTRGNNSYYAKALNIVKSVLPKLKRHRVSFLNGDAGPTALGAVLYFREGEKKEATRLVKCTVSLVSEVLHSKVPDEVLYGRAGYLYSLLFINKHMGSDMVPASTIRKVIAAILNSGKELAARERVRVPLIYQWHEKHYLGAAHGLAGILYMLLMAKDYMDQADIDTLVRPTIDSLQDLQFPSGNFPSSLESNKDRLVQWCHGAPGMVELFCAAYRVFQKDSYLNTALQCGEIVWQRGLLKKGYSICHGVSGNAYTFLRLYQETHDPKHLHRAFKFAEWCTGYGRYQSHPPDRPWSLFEGVAGVIYFLFDIQHPDSASFPAYALY